MLAIRLDAETEQALLEYLDDLEDIYLAKKELEDIKAGRSGVVSWQDVKGKAGL